MLPLDVATAEQYSMSCWLGSKKMQRPDPVGRTLAGSEAPPGESAAEGVGGSTGGGALPSVLQVAKDARDGLLNTDGLAAAGGAISANEL